MEDLPAFPLDIDAIATAIEIPTDRWPGNCHAIASAVLRKLPVEGMRLVRGHYDGPISRDSVYRGGPQQHSWLRLQDGRILDPTRWCMTRPTRPYLYLDVNDAYDEAGMMLALRARAAMSGSLASIGALRVEDALQARLDKMDPALRSAIFQALGESKSSGHSLHTALMAPVEHLQHPERFFGALEAAGMRALVKADNWIRVMEPERVTPARGINQFYVIPPRDPLGPQQMLFRVFCHFLSIEIRGERIERELEEIGYSLDDLHDALNEMETVLRIDPDLSWAPVRGQDLLCHVAMDLLGAGFGEELRVERYADSLGYDRHAFDRALGDFGERAGITITWIYPPQPPVEALPQAPEIL